ncbi:hypothetical protein VNO80_06888 [Phaseolus coccineus]|uniref:Uncharacterized protein n=1 Tax=Phaseolus coccineus TaxID=3886 RepID=A0AAN9NPK2_PHACN
MDGCWKKLSVLLQFHGGGGQPLVLSRKEHHRATSLAQLAFVSQLTSIRRTTPSRKLAGEASKFSSTVYTPIPI